MTRRKFFSSAAVPLAAGAFTRSSRAAFPLSKLGIASTSFVSAFQVRLPEPGAPEQRTTIDFLEKCHDLGAGGIQAQISGDPARLRARAGELGMYVEGMVSLPKTSDTSAFERTLQHAKAAGASVLRCAALSGRRYESFDSIADRGGEYLARTLKLVQKYNSTHKPPPLVSQLSREDRNRLEEDNVKACLRYSQKNLESIL